jgi:hypothetical protein
MGQARRVSGRASVRVPTTLSDGPTVRPVHCHPAADPSSDRAISLGPARADHVAATDRYCAVAADRSSRYVKDFALPSDCPWLGSP